MKIRLLCCEANAAHRPATGRNFRRGGADAGKLFVGPCVEVAFRKCPAAGKQSDLAGAGDHGSEGCALLQADARECGEAKKKTAPGPTSGCFASAGFTRSTRCGWPSADGHAHEPLPPGRRANPSRPRHLSPAPAGPSETFVELERFTGACYRAANWIEVGTTKGRGKLEKNHQSVLPLKNILLYPLQKNFRAILAG